MMKNLFSPVSEVDGEDVSSMASGSSSRRVCSGLSGVRTGGAGAFLAFDRRLRNINGPIPDAKNNDTNFFIPSFRTFTTTIFR